MFVIKPKLTTENIFKRVDSYNIFRYYSTHFKNIGESFMSDFRKESSPSACVIYNRGDLLYTDFGDVPNKYSDRGSYRAITFVQRLFDITFIEALNKINTDLGLDLTGSDDNIINKPTLFTSPEVYKEKLTTIIKIHEIEHTIKTLKYWEQFGWTKQMLFDYCVKNIDYYWITNDKYVDKMINTSYKLSFSYDYYWNKNVFRRKLYFPENINSRFISNVDNTIVQGWDQLPKNENNKLLFITKGLKDVGGFKRLGYNSIAPNNEVSFIPEKIYKSKIKNRFKHIIIWYDNDETGIKGAKNFSEYYDIPYFIVPKTSECKDPSDFIKKEGLREFNYLITEKLYGIKIHNFI